jgi:hypothetical protein
VARTFSPIARVSALLKYVTPSHPQTGLYSSDVAEMGWQVPGAMQFGRRQYALGSTQGDSAVQGMPVCPELDEMAVVVVLVVPVAVLVVALVVVPPAVPVEAWTVPLVPLVPLVPPPLPFAAVKGSPQLTITALPHRLSAPTAMIAALTSILRSPAPR